MPQIYLKIELYDRIVKQGFEVPDYVDQVVRQALGRKESRKMEVPAK